MPERRLTGMKTTSYICMFLALATVMMGSHRRGGHHHRQPRVIVYEDSHFRGGSLTLYPGDQIRNLKRARFNTGKRVNDQISSVRVIGGASILLFDHHNMRGRVMRVSSNIRNLAHREMPHSSIAWNDRITSLKVMGERPRRGHANRPDVTHRRAPREVWGRSSDIEVTRHHRRGVFNHGRSEPTVRRHGGRSYRDSAERIVRRSYRDILKREPDASGMSHYTRMIRQRGMSEAQLRRDLRRSDEYRRTRRMARHR